MRAIVFSMIFLFSLLLPYSRISAQDSVSSSGNVRGTAQGSSDVLAELNDTENRIIVSAATSGYIGKDANFNEISAWTSDSQADDIPQYVSFSLILSGEIKPKVGGGAGEETLETYFVKRTVRGEYWIEGDASVIPLGESIHYIAKSNVSPLGENSSWSIKKDLNGITLYSEGNSTQITTPSSLSVSKYYVEGQSESNSSLISGTEFSVAGILNLTSGKTVSPNGAGKIQTLYVAAGKPFTIKANRDPKNTANWPDGKPTFDVDGQSISATTAAADGTKTIATSSSVTIDSKVFTLTWNAAKDTVTFEQLKDETHTEDYFGTFMVTAWCGNSQKSMRVAVCGVDLRVDSNNDGKIDDEDETIEEDPDKPGKIMGVNNSDKDNDCIPDFADGFGIGSGCNAANSKRTAFNSLITTDFIELQVSISDSVVITDETVVKFLYPFSDPKNLTEERMDGEDDQLRTKIDGSYEEIYRYRPASGNFRIWKLPEDAERSAESITEDPSKGCIASGTEISAAELGFSNSVRTVTLYVEAVQAAYQSPVEVQFTFKPASGDSEITVSDIVTITAVDPQMYVDGNWDGIIKDEDPRDRRLDDFWINNDIDTKEKTNVTGFAGEIIGYYSEEDRKSGTPNCNDEKINCLRDLEDFKVLKITSGMETLPDSWSSQVKVSIRTLQENGIRLFSFTPDEDILTYLTDFSVGETLIEKDTTVTPDDLVIRNNTGDMFLFEARNAVQAVVLELKYNNIVIAKDIINMEVRESSSFVDVNMIYPAGSSLAPYYVFTYPRIRFEEEKDLLLLVHGMNMGGEDDRELRGWAETIHKRLKHMGFYGTVAAVKWVDSGFLAYNDSEYTAWKSGVTLSNYISGLLQRGVRVNILAHSQGNVVTGQALRILPPQSVKTYIATQAAISGHCYGSMVNPTINGETVDIDNLISEGPDIYMYYHSGKPDHLSGNPPKPDLPYLSSVPQKTNMINYYNYSDYALSFWEINNYLKRRNLSMFFYDAEKDDYYYINLLGNYKYLTADDRADGDMDNRFEIFSYVAYSHSHALGVGEIAGKNNFDLEKNIFKNHPNKCVNEDSHLYHSWQFLQSFSETKEYWLHIVKDISNKGNTFKIFNNNFFESIKEK